MKLCNISFDGTSGDAIVGNNNHILNDFVFGMGWHIDIHSGDNKSIEPVTYMVK